MASFPNVDKPQPPRPNLQRKSSAQNLLNQFKPSNSASNASIPQVPLSLGAGAASVTSPMAYNGQPMSSGSTTPLPREWDAQSLHSDNPAMSGAVSPQLGGQGMSVEYLRELVQKRMITLTYIRNIHEGCVVVRASCLHQAHQRQAEPLVSHNSDYSDRAGNGVQQ
mgnify:FL=1